LPEISAEMIATMGLRILTADSVPTAAIPVPLKGACLVGFAPSDPIAQPGMSAVSVAVRSDLLVDKVRIIWMIALYRVHVL
jgi:hypothetical protein